MHNNGKKEERLGRREEKGRLPQRFNFILNYHFGEREQQIRLSPKGVQFSFAAHDEQILTDSRGSRVAGRGSRVAGPQSRSRVQCRGRGSNVAAGENDLGFEVTE